MKNILVIIDDQFDFCNPQGNLYVPGAENDCRRLSAFIDKNGASISAIYATMDAHLPYHIAHPLFWKTKEGKTPSLYTVISSQNIEEGLYTPADSSQKDFALSYVKELEKKGKYQLCIWPPHCLIGSTGQTIDTVVFSALTRWQENNVGKIVNYITKATSPFTEQYSAIEAEVPIEDDESTHKNVKFIEELKKADRIIFSGEALSHCVANTIKDLLNDIPATKITILTDCTSVVAGFQEEGKAFLSELKNAGARLETSALKL